MDQLFENIYAEMRVIARARLRNERLDHTLQPTALVHEAFLKLVDQTRVEWHSRSHYFAVAAMAMRRILVDHARMRRRVRRGGGRVKVQFDEVRDVVAPSERRVDAFIALDDALRELENLSQRQAQVVELKVFAGLSNADAAKVLDLSTRTVDGDWAAAKAWLAKRLSDD